MDWLVPYQWFPPSWSSIWHLHDHHIDDCLWISLPLPCCMASIVLVLDARFSRAIDVVEQIAICV
ncbi:uncharacterized protein K489DRAFT_378736 [Dissoconium aciculare CBS 342.82]|uniref:Uncharacterized protein n=1 Tax=Dissoconium aciculare CBS 342.82 TaxID=1314786 RepID=A0A6J3M8X0_9PEZI|nr:uncharacterized protein K489DRAFT_378736 [Dissoconium aciculare CBS 342.82]KAF1824323.1 hypothetical protein K489DRAFT_378736 [Dissoconium aciculare CBS 342.82]